MNMSNKLLLGLLLTVLLFVTVMLGMAKVSEQDRKDQERASQEQVAPPAVPEAPAPPAAEAGERQ